MRNPESSSSNKPSSSSLLSQRSELSQLERDLKEVGIGVQSGPSLKSLDRVRG
jgi:hypothetical protein